MTTHIFEIDIATKVGVNAAVIHYNLAHWSEKNRANGKHIHDGKAWTYNSNKAFQSLFPYMSEKAIRTAISKLKKSGLIEVRNDLNNIGYDRTTWYCIICRKGQMDVPKRANGCAEKGRPIPNVNTDIKPNTKKYIKKAKTRIKSDWKPTEIETALSKGMTNDTIEDQVRGFFDHHKSKGSLMCDWQAAWRTWCSNWVKFGSHQAGGSTAGSFQPEGGGSKTESLATTANRIRLERARSRADGEIIEGNCRVSQSDGESPF